ncbi:MAG: TfuA domain protein, core, partial [Deltaproteobacteria bacterium]|nr:TfuA domain protein, core [Deltaproteobacteria bacterium]
MTTHIFAGPTLAAAEIAARVPDAIIHPPVAVGDVWRLARRRGVTRIAIIDGYFERMA